MEREVECGWGAGFLPGVCVCVCVCACRLPLPRPHFSDGYVGKHTGRSYMGWLQGSPFSKHICRADVFASHVFHKKQQCGASLVTKSN